MVTTTNSGLDASRVLSDLAESAADGFQRARNDASRAAERTVPVLRRSLAKTAYTLAYFVSFGAVYSAAVVTEMLPADGVIRQGLRDGAAAAHNAHAERRLARQFQDGREQQAAASEAVGEAP